MDFPIKTVIFYSYVTRGYKGTFRTLQVGIEVHWTLFILFGQADVVVSAIIVSSMAGV